MGKIIVVYGGGFQPFHAGHLSSYLEAKEAFPNADFYVAASNDTKTRPIPFDDKQFLAQQAGVTDPFVQVKMPINPTEILDRYSPKKDIFILVRSERDPVGYTKKDGSPGYYQPFTDISKCKPFGYHGYVFVTHKKEFKLNGQVVYSGTQVRDMYANSDDHGRLNIIKQLYPNSSEQESIKQMLDKYIGSSEPIVEPDKSAIKQLKAKKLKEQIQRMRPLIREASIEQKYKLLKLIKEVTQLDELNLFKKKKSEPVKDEPKDEPATSPNDYHAYFNKPNVKQQTVYHGPEEYVSKTKLDPITGKKVVDELAPNPQGSGGGNYFRELASAWYNGTYKSKSLQKGIKSQQDIERLLQRGIIAPDGQTRKYNIDYNSDFDGVIIFSDDYYEYGDYDSKGRTVDSRTGKPYGPYDYMEFNDDELDESLIEFAIPGGDDNEPDEEEILFRLAKQWWLGNQQDMIRAERTLASMGWEIGEDEGYDDGGVFVVRAGDVNGKSYISWPHEDLIVDEGQTSDMRDFFKTQQPLNPAPTIPTTTGPTIATVTRQSEGINEISDETLQSYLGKADLQISNRLDRMSQARDRLNKNYEIYDVNNPAKIIDRFEADTPKLAKQYFDKFIQEYNPGDIDFHFDVRRSTGIIEDNVSEARLHFTDPNARINVYYITPKLHREGKIQNLAHNIPYKLLEPFTQALMKKYKLVPDYVVWHHVGKDPNEKYGERIEESQDYLEEK